MSLDLIYQIALTLVPNIGCIHAKNLIENFSSAENVFKARKKDLSAIENIGIVKATSIKEFEDLNKRKMK